jgi:hypothetical protein
MKLVCVAPDGRIEIWHRKVQRIPNYSNKVHYIIEKLDICGCHKWFQTFMDDWHWGDNQIEPEYWGREVLGEL